MRTFLLMTLICVVECHDPNVEELKIPLRQWGEGCGFEGCPSIKEDMVNVHIVPHTHAEVGFIDTFYQFYDGVDDIFAKSHVHMKRILDYTITELWAQQHRKFTLSDSPYLFHWWSNRDITVRRMVYQLLRQGRLHIVGGGWGMVDETSTSYHGIIDQYTYTLRKLNATFGPCGLPLVAWQADTFGHSREHTTLAALLGFHGLFVHPISFEDELQRAREKHMEMLWRGSDDIGPATDIFTHKLFDGYWAPPGFCFGTMCSDPLLITSDSQFSNIEERVDAFLESVRFRQAPHYQTNHIMIVMGQQYGYYDASMWFENIDKLIHKVNEKSYSSGQKVHLMYSAPACYLKAVYDSNPTLSIKQDDFMPVAFDRENYFSGLFTSRPTIKYMVREGHVYLLMAHQLQVLAQLSNNDNILEELHWVVGIMQDHNVISGAMRRYVKEDYTYRMYFAVQKSTLIMKQAFNKLRNSRRNTLYYRCSFNVSSCRNTNAERSFIVIYNPLAWPVTIPVRLPTMRKKYIVYDPNLNMVQAVMMKLPDFVRKIPSRSTNAGHEVVFIATRVPAMGYRSYYIDGRKKENRKRSIFKKVTKKKNRKYIVRQVASTDEKKSNFDPQDYDEEPDYINIPELNSTGDTIESTDMKPLEEKKPVNFVPYAIKPKEVSLEEVEYKPLREREKYSKVNAAFETDNKDDSYFSNFFYSESSDNFIGNKYITVKLDSLNNAINLNLSNGIEIKLKIRICYYASDDPVRMNRPNDTKPGPNVFKPMDNKPVVVYDFVESKVHKSILVEEVQVSYARWAHFVLRIYEDRPIVEVDWVIGPIPIENDIGKDVFIRYYTNLNNNGVFYTDSNGRQTIKRIRNYKPSYEPVFPDSIPGNFYPVTSKIYIEDINKNIRFSIFNDRAQGGSSLYDGQIDLMLHRRILTDEGNVQCFLNDTENGQGIIVRGKHYIYLSRANYKPNKIFEKKFAKEIELAPKIFASEYNAEGEDNKFKWEQHNNEYAGITKKLPVGVHILTLQEWNDKTLLIRLENYLEKSDVVKTGERNVFLNNLFEDIDILGLDETTLGANIWLQDYMPLKWNSDQKFVKNFNEYYGGNGTLEYSEDYETDYAPVNITQGIKLTPQQIRTFVVRYKIKSRSKI